MENNLNTQLENWSLWQRAQGASERTIIERRRLILLFGRRMDCDPPAAAESDVLRFMSAIREFAWSTRCSYFSNLKTWFTWLVMTGARVDNPCLRVPPPKYGRHKPRPITDVELALLLIIRMHARAKTMILLAAFQGFRVHEIAKIRGEDVDLAAGTLHVIGKGRYEAWLPLHPLVAREAARYPRRGYWFTTYTGNELGHSGHVLARSVSDTVSLAMDRGGISGGAHRLRHWYGTSLVAAGVNIRIVQELMRHQSIQTTQIYTEISIEQQRQAILLLHAPTVEAPSFSAELPEAA